MVNVTKVANAAHLKLVTSQTADAQAWIDTIAAREPAAAASTLREVMAFVAPRYAEHTLASGEAVLAHVMGAVPLLGDLHLGHEAIAAELLWPLLEFDALDAAATRTMRERCGGTIVELAEGVQRMSAIGALSSRRTQNLKPEAQAAQLEALRKMLLAMVQDVRVVLIKLADHTQDLRHAVKSADQTARRETAQLTRDIFAPLANRLGVWQLKWELEDLAFRIIEPDTYKEIAHLLDDKRSNREGYIGNVMNSLKAELARAGIRGDVMGRPKHIYSIYNKMRRKHADFEALHDVRAVRVLVDDVKDCYAVLGMVHHLWSPIPKEFDDYIAKPKGNNYRSLHTAVIGPEGKSVEVQIRTHEMHQSSELGVAAHWRYKEGGRQKKGYKDYDGKIAWLRQILDWKDEVRDTGELAEQFKTGLFDDTIYVLTPQGRVVDLPVGATPIDFAYHVHTELGHRCRGAKVDGAMAPLNTVLHNGQQVEIISAAQGGPSRDWMNPQRGFIKSQSARARVRQWFNRLNFDVDVAQGRAMLEKELQRHGLTAMNLDKLAEGEGYAKLDDFLADIARGDVGPKRLQDALRPPPPEPVAEMPAPKKPRANSGGGVLVVGVDKLLTVPAKCCKPAPPEPIVGFVSRGRGVTVHRASCSNVKRLDPERMVTAEWGAASGATFPAEVEIEALDRTGLLRDISEVFTRERANVIATNTLTKDMLARMRFTLEISNLEQLHRVLAMIREVKGVLRAGRR